MNAKLEKRLLQGATAVACIVPLAAGGQGVVESAAMIGDVERPLPIDLDSHFRYLSGLLVGIGIGFLACIKNIERKGSAYRLLAMIVVVGGLARLLSAVQFGLPGGGHRFGLIMELLVVPALALWQFRIERLFQK